MKSRAKFFMLILSLSVLAGAWLLAEYMSGAFAPEESLAVNAEGERFYLAVGSPGQLTALSWSYDGQTVNLKRNASGEWINADDRACPVDHEKAEALALAMASATANMAIENVTDFAQYGLDKPSLTIMAAAGEEVARYALGNMSITGQHYLRRDEEDTVYLENGALAPAFRVRLEEILELETLPDDIAQVTGLSVRTEAGEYALARVQSGVWQLQLDEQEPQTMKEDKASLLYAPLLELELTRCETWNAVQPEKYGLAEPQGTVTLAYMTAEGAEKSCALEFGSYAGSDVYVRFRGSRMVYVVSGAVLDGLMYPNWETMLPLNVLPIEPRSVAQIDMALDGREFHIDRLTETESAGEVIYSCNGWILDTEQMDDWLKKLAELPADSLAPEAEGRHTLMELTLTWGDDTGQPATLEIRSYDSVHHLCIVDGERRLLVPREAADELVAQAESALITE